MRHTKTRLSAGNQAAHDPWSAPGRFVENLKVVFGKKRAMASGLVWLLAATGVKGADAPAAGGTGVTFAQVPEGAKVIKFRLAVAENTGPRHQGYLSQRSPQALEEVSSLPPAIAQTYAGKGFTAFVIAALPNGTQYLAVLNEDKSLKFLNREDSTMYYARIYRVTPGSDAKPELLREGFQSPGNDVVLPAELEFPAIGANKVKSLRTEIGYSFQGQQNGNPQVYSGRGSTLTVTGSQLTPEGKLTLSVTVPDEMTVTSETQVTLRFEPMIPGLPDRTAAGKITDFLTLGAGRFVVSELAPDFSSANLALVAGSLEQTIKQQLQLGTQMPPFSQVELVSRKATTREEVLTRAKTAGGVVFIFGDLPSPGPRYGGGYMPSSVGGGNMNLPLPTTEVAEQFGLGLQRKPLVVFVTRQISIEFLYQDLRNKTPDYLILTDYADPLRTSFRVPQNVGGYYGPSYPMGQDPSLRQLFNLSDRLAIVAFDSTGKVVYVKADAGSSFLSSVAEARTALKGAK
jgi:hypothetical protein